MPSQIMLHDLIGHQMHILVINLKRHVWTVQLMVLLQLYYRHHLIAEMSIQKTFIAV